MGRLVNKSVIVEKSMDLQEREGESGTSKGHGSHDMEIFNLAAAASSLKAPQKSLLFQCLSLSLSLSAELSLFLSFFAVRVSGPAKPKQRSFFLVVSYSTRTVSPIR